MPLLNPPPLNLDLKAASLILRKQNDNGARHEIIKNTVVNADTNGKHADALAMINGAVPFCENDYERDVLKAAAAALSSIGAPAAVPAVAVEKAKPAVAEEDLKPSAGKR